jgi:transcriptional regulator with XRE-family HTH domain
MYRDDLLRSAAAVQNRNISNVAELTGLTRVTVSLILKGKPDIKLPTLKVVADALGVSMHDLFEERAA